MRPACAHRYCGLCSRTPAIDTATGHGFRRLEARSTNEKGTSRSLFHVRRRSAGGTADQLWLAAGVTRLASFSLMRADLPERWRR